MSSKLSTCVVALLVAGLMAAGAAWAQKSDPEIVQSIDQAGSSDFAPPEGPSIVLFDQPGNGVTSITSQDFEAAFNAYDATAADDFDVTFPDGWTIEQVNVPGTFSAAGPMAGVNVNFYDDAGGLPGTAVCSYAGLIPTTPLGDPSPEVPLPTPCILAAGTYWVGVQVIQDFGCCGQWFWTEHAGPAGAESAWENPGGGFGTPCTTWGPRVSVCGVGTSPDMGVQLIGLEGGAGTPTMPPAAMLLLLTALLAIGLVVTLRRRTA